MIRILLSLLVLVDAGLGASILSKRFDAHSTHEQRRSFPHGWAKRSSSSSSSRLHQRTSSAAAATLDKKSSTLPMRIHLTQRNMENAHDFLMNVSDPLSPNYGKHWTPKQVVDAFAPSQEAVDDVSEWLAHAGIPRERVTFHRSKGVSFLSFFFFFSLGRRRRDSLLNSLFTSN
jgi:tripeptidyl-peptidase-1